MDTRHHAARLEDWVTARANHLLGARGWVPTVLGYTGYGSTSRPAGADAGALAAQRSDPASPDGVAHAEPGAGWVRVLARVVLSRPLREGESEPVEPVEGEPLGAAAVKALRGWRSFVTAPVVAARVEVRVGGRVHVVLSDRGGYVDAVVEADLVPGDHQVELRVVGASPAADAAGSEGSEGSAADEPVTASVVVIDSDQRHGIVSDIDDTVMVTSLPRPLLAAWNTFVLYPQARRPVPGMADLLTEAAARHPGAPVLYLSTGAWNVAPTLARFIVRHGFPTGPMLLTDWGPTNSGWFRSGQQHKHAALRRLQRELPQVEWLLVGDDGQHDPVIYREFATEAPDQVRAIAIRQLTPTEQLLSHGLPVPVSARTGRGSVPEVRGPDGTNLLRQLRGAGLV